MNINKLIEEITEKVVSVINEKQQSSDISSQNKDGLSSHKSSEHLIIIFSGYPYDDKHVSNIIQILLNASNKSIFMLSPEIQYRCESIIPNDRLLSLNNYSSVETKYNESSFLLVPVLPLSILGKLALLISGDNLTDIISRALISGKEIYTFSSDYILQSNPKIQSQIIEYKEQLNKLGIKTISQEEYHKLFGNNYIYANNKKDNNGKCKALTSECDACGSCPSKIQEAVEKILNTGASRIGTTLGALQSDNHLAQYIDHTLLKPDATKEDVMKLCEEAKRYSFASVCINP